MNKKYAYCTSITKDVFIPCIILNKRIMDYLGCKYPLVVLVTDEVSKEGIKEMEDFNIIVKQVPSLIFNFLDNDNEGFFNLLKDIMINYSCFLLEEYDLIFNFEADIVLLENIENLFDVVNKKIKKHHNFAFWKDRICYKSNLNEINTQIFFCKPNLKIYNEITSLINKSKLIKDDHSVARIFYYNNPIIEDEIKMPLIIHFRGHPKIWIFRDYFPFLKELFYNNKKSLTEKEYNFLANNADMFDNFTRIIKIEDKLDILTFLNIKI